MTSCRTLSDPKARGEPLLYFPADFLVPQEIERLRGDCHIQFKVLPRKIEKPGEIDPGTIDPPGLLYLENPYVVPGGRFNEMYGWDSYFILRGLLPDGRLKLARGMVENFLFEIDHYGGVLNANRTYYLSRSQPPFLTSMILAVYQAEGSRHQGLASPQGLAWLRRAYPYAVKDYDLWTHEPHLAGDTGLSRFYDFGDGPVPELADTPGSYYRSVAAYFVLHPDGAESYLRETHGGAAPSNLVGSLFHLNLCHAEPGATGQEARHTPGRDSDCERVANLGLTSDYYKGDRSMRESGFDVSFRFGPYGARTHRFAPVCLNSLLYKAEQDLEWMSVLLGRPQVALEWRRRAAKRRETVNRYLWNEQRGLYLDYDFSSGKQSSYVFATMFYPLWAGLASAAQAEAVVRNLKLLEQPGGLAMSQQETRAQWDYPYGWAPLHLIAVEGLRRYGYQTEAGRLSYEFLSMVLENFRRDGTIREKYNVVTRSSETRVEAGYSENVIGFGWTNGVFVELLNALPKEMANRLGVK